MGWKKKLKKEREAWAASDIDPDEVDRWRRCGLTCYSAQSLIENGVTIELYEARLAAKEAAERARTLAVAAERAAQEADTAQRALEGLQRAHEYLTNDNNHNSTLRKETS